MYLELAPEMESRVREYAEAEGVSVNELIDRHFPPRPRITEQNTRARVQSLLSAWQQEYGMPTLPGSGKTLAELTAEWRAEDANMTSEQIEQERAFWEEYEQSERQYISI